MGMVFVRCRKGISHSPDEWSSREDCEAGTEVLYRTVLDLAVEERGF
jgi:allantoate deiminase